MKKYTNEDNKKDRDKFRLLFEYDFYVEEEEVYDPELDNETGEIITEEPPEGEAPEGGDEMGDEEFPEAGSEELPEPEAMEDEVELDVTELVQGTEEAKASSDRASQQIDILMGKFETLSQSLEKMTAINQKIDDLEHEIEKRNPTPQERLEMQSLNSFPYSLKLTDYWSEKEGNYDAMGGQKEDEEYVLTQDEVDRDYNAIEIKDSFVNPNEDEFIKKKF